MNTHPGLDDRISLANDRIAPEDALRQEVAAGEILRRFVRQPGVILADEVGMGKTFVALAVAASVALSRQDDGPVVVMTPPNLRQKWPKDWDVFKTKCLAPEVGSELRCDSADTGVQFLRLLDDPAETRAAIIFLTHGALSRSMGDSLVRLAILKRAMKGRRSLDVERANLGRFGGRLLQLGYLESMQGGLIESLLNNPYSRWKSLLPDQYWGGRRPDDPIPAHLAEALEDLSATDLEPIVTALRSLPQRESKSLDTRLRDLRRALSGELEKIWTRTLTSSDFHSPLLILDEAHHAKNPGTRLASLFGSPEASEDASVVSRAGALGGKFDRMLFLTATPFQLGHSELISVLERFEGVRWSGTRTPELSRAQFIDELKQLRTCLDCAQSAALRLDATWSALRVEDFPVPPSEDPGDDGSWWSDALASSADGPVARAAHQVEVTRGHMLAAEKALSPWVLRHIKPQHLSGHAGVPRRTLLPGAGIEDTGRTGEGIGIGVEVVLPFLLAGRAQTLLARLPRTRALFAEGLASSFEAYLDTRKNNAAAALDNDAEPAENEAESAELDWYLRHLDLALPSTSGEMRMLHPKVAATARRVVELWKQGEKVLVFCHYRATGRALRQHISTLLHREILRMASEKLPGLTDGELEARLEGLGDRFSDPGPLHRAVGDWLAETVGPYPFDEAEAGRVVAVVRRFIRTPSFLVRYLPLDAQDLVAAFGAAIDLDGSPGGSLRTNVEQFCRFLAHRCTVKERAAYLDALDLVQTGTHRGHDVAGGHDAGEESTSDVPGTVLLPNVRLANGEVRQETRQRLLLTFNTPLFPEILIASSVMAEGVDLHLNCRHVIHHDLCWNPSTLEQRSGRVDRIGSRAERVGRSILLYMPYVAATQDEKMFRVVRDRERWFQIVMGERYESDEAATDRKAARIPLPPQVQRELSLKLH